jgi:TPR repeat protein
MHHRWAIAFLVLLIVLGAATAAAEYYYPSEARHVMSQMQSKVERFVNPAGTQRAAEAENASMAGVTRFEGAFEPGKSPRDPLAQPVIPPVPSSETQPTDPAASQPDVSHVVTAPSPDVDAPKNSAETDLELAQTYLSHSDNPDEKAKALQLLWLATEKGNVDAEMELADLYARGDGVAKSCVQARILLKAALAVNAPAAQPKLDALDQSGCS